MTCRLSMGQDYECSGVEGPGLLQLIARCTYHALTDFIGRIVFWVFSENIYIIQRVIGPPERIRTSDLCLRRAALYPAELRAVQCGLACHVTSRLARTPGVG